MADWNRIGEKANAAITAAEGREAKALAKMPWRKKDRAALEHAAKVAARQAKYLREK